MTATAILQLVEQLKAGNRDAAVAAYQKALEIDPKLESSARALEGIQKRTP